MAGEGSNRTDYDELHAGTRHGHIHAAEVAQKADVAFVVASHKGDDDDVAFLALKAVDGVDGDEMTERLEEWCPLDKATQILHLCPVRRYESYVYALVEETLSAYLFNISP